MCGQSSGYLDLIEICYNRELVNVSSVHMQGTGYINCVAKIRNDTDSPVKKEARPIITSDPSAQTKEFQLALACEKGLFFGKFVGTQFHLNHDEAYHERHLVSQVIDLGNSQLLFHQFDKAAFYILDRAHKQIQTITNEGALNCSDMRLLPGFHIDNLPFVLVRTIKGIKIVDVQKKSLH